MLNVYNPVQLNRLLYRSARDAIGSPAPAIGRDFDRLAPRGSRRREETDLCPPDPRAAVGREAGKAGKTESLQVFPAIGAPDREPCWEALLRSVLRDSGRTVTAVPPCEVLAGACIARLLCSQARPVPAAPMKRGCRVSISGDPHTELGRFGTCNARLKRLVVHHLSGPPRRSELCFSPSAKHQHQPGRIVGRHYLRA